MVVAAGLSVALFYLGRYTASARPGDSVALAKSIAVLPFENRIEDKTNSYLADGIQDEILTRLAKIEDLKVISRTSTQRYKSSPENLAEIAKQLSVAYPGGKCAESRRPRSSEYAIDQRPHGYACPGDPRFEKLSDLSKRLSQEPSMPRLDDWARRRGMRSAAVCST